MKPQICPMNFGSDNFAGVHPAIAANLSKHGAGYATPYGNSELDDCVQRRLNEIFEREVAVFFVATGTASNSLALASSVRSGGMVLAHREAHIIVDECGAPEYLSGGQFRTTAVNGAHGKMDADELRRQADRISRFKVHGGRLSAISVTQPTETGTVYSLDELDAISAVAREHGIPVHMDGARFANGLVSLGCTPAEMTWKRGVDVLSFGATKNGCWCAEAIIFFDTGKAHDFTFVRKRAGQLFSKSRFVAAQLEAYLERDLWLKLASHANAMAADLADALRRSRSARLAREPRTNEVFAVLDRNLVAELEMAGAVFMEWPAMPEVEMRDDEQLCRFVTSFETRPEDIGVFARLLGSFDGDGARENGIVENGIATNGVTKNGVKTNGFVVTANGVKV